MTVAEELLDPQVAWAWVAPLILKVVTGKVLPAFRLSFVPVRSRVLKVVVAEPPMVWVEEPLNWIVLLVEVNVPPLFSQSPPTV